MKIYTFIKNGFEETECLIPVDYLRRANIEIKTVSFEKDLEVTGAHGIKVIADLHWKDAKDKITAKDAIFLPGGLDQSTGLRDNPEAIETLKKAGEQGQTVTAICAAPMVLAKAGLLKDKNYTCYPSIEKGIKDGKFTGKGTTVDGNIITAKGPAFAAELAFLLIEKFKGKAVLEETKAGLLY